MVILSDKSILNIRKHAFLVIFPQLYLPSSGSCDGCQNSLTRRFIYLILIELSRETSEELSQIQKYQNTGGQMLHMNLS